ncbi:MAG: phosphatase, partial [Nocardioidaceae bacterium]|nr:phosphatase [Nocardioidaceae bacterium]
MRIDLHTHSNRSDGTDSPSELVANAVAAGLDVIAITDHDSTAGWDEATEAAAGTSLRLVHGIEISTLLDYRSIHLLGYEFDPTNAPLLEELDRILGGRDGRLPLILKALQSHGVAITEADVLRWSDNAAATGRPHVADALVELGVVKDRTEAFDVWLKPGRPAYIDRYAADLFDA